MAKKNQSKDNIKSKPLLQQTVEPPAKKQEFYHVPNSPTNELILKTLGSGINVADLPVRSKKINNNAQITVSENGKKRQIIINSNRTNITLELTDIDKLLGSNKAAKKMFVFALIKINNQAYSNNILHHNCISFSLNELVDIGFYSSPRSARQGFNDATDILTSLKVKGSLHASSKKETETTINALEVLFTGANIKNSYCTIYLNERINWAFLTTFYTLLPHYCFKLPNRAFDLLYYVFYLARQNTEKIANKGYFTINLKAIQMRLNLPSEKKNNDPQKTIKDPIENAIVAIENENWNSNFALTLIYDEKSSIDDYLNNGYLKVELKEKFAKNFITFSKKKTKKINLAQKHRKTLIDKAKIKTLQKQIEKEKDK